MQPQKENKSPMVLSSLTVLQAHRLASSLLRAETLESLETQPQLKVAKSDSIRCRSPPHRISNRTTLLVLCNTTETVLDLEHTKLLFILKSVKFGIMFLQPRTYNTAIIIHSLMDLEGLDLLASTK